MFSFYGFSFTKLPWPKLNISLNIIYTIYYSIGLTYTKYKSA